MNKTSQPLVSVVMPAYNAGVFLVESIESILNQTYPNIEFIIVDDASTDSTAKILRNYKAKYKQITVMRNKKNEGVSSTVRKAIEKAKGEYIARMDADDIALPNRIERQVSYLESHPKTVAVGGQCLLIDKNGTMIGRKTFPTKFEDIYRYSYQFVPIQQPTLMIARKRLPEDFAYYIDGMNTAEEVELFFKLFQYGKVENLPDWVLLYRMHDKNTSFINIRKTFFLTLLARIKAVYAYNYKPNMKGITITAMQTIIVFLLPQKITLLVYKALRNMILRIIPNIYYRKNLAFQPFLER